MQEFFFELFFKINSQNKLGMYPHDWCICQNWHDVGFDQCHLVLHFQHARCANQRIEFGSSSTNHLQSFFYVRCEVDLLINCDSVDWDTEVPTLQCLLSWYRLTLDHYLFVWWKYSLMRVDGDFPHCEPTNQLIS